MVISRVGLSRVNDCLWVMVVARVGLSQDRIVSGVGLSQVRILLLVGFAFVNGSLGLELFKG